MKKYLTESEYSCWQKYVQAVSLFCSRNITHRNVNIADVLINDFCLKFEEYKAQKRALRIFIFIATCLNQ